MRRRNLILPMALGVLSTSLLACGGNSGLSPGQVTPESAYPGITFESFRAVRYNDWGYRDSSLNSTLKFTCERDQATTTLVVSIADTRPMRGVALDLKYDPARLTPQTTEFSGLIDSPLSLASSGTLGLVNLGQASLVEPQSRAGEFARVVFLNQPNRHVSALNPAHSGPINIVYPDPLGSLPVASAARGFEVLNNNAEIGSDATYRIRALFTIGDGNDDGASNIGDLTPMSANGFYGQHITPTDYGPAQTDYSHDGETSINDLTPLGQNLNKQTFGIEILLGDTPLLGSNDLLRTLTWTNGVQPQRPPTQGTTDWGDVFHTWEGKINLQQMVAADVNGDKTVYISARPTNGLEPQLTFPGEALTYSQPFPPGVQVSGFAISVNGTAAAGGSVITAAANSSGIPMAVTGISGNYTVDVQVLPFTPDTIPSEMGQTTYDQALTNARELIQWSSSANPLAGANYRNVNPLITVIDDGAGGWLASTGPDEAAGAEGANGEGLLTATLPVTGTFVTADVKVQVVVDLTPDARVPVFSAIETGQEDGAANPRLSTSSDTTVFAFFDFGTTEPEPSAYPTLPVQLLDFTDPTLSFDLVYDTDESFLAGEYTIAPNTQKPDNGAALQLKAKTPGGNIVPGHEYGIRLKADFWSSVNYPATPLPTDALPAPVTLVSLPPADQLNPLTDYVRLFYPVPKLRRDPRVIVNEADGRVSPADLDGWNDFIKNSGEAGEAEFPITVAGGRVFPQIVVVKDAAPGTILPTSTSELVNIVERTKGSITIDISAITPNTGFGGGTYGYKLFGAAALQADWPELGSGTWVIDALPLSAPPMLLRDFGVDIFDGTGHGDLALAARDYTSPMRKIKNVDIVNDFGLGELYVEFTGGAFFDYNADPALAYNVQLRLLNPSRGEMTRPLIPRVAGIDIGGLPYTIASYTFVASDWYSPADPLHTGVLEDNSAEDPAKDITVKLFNSYSNIEATFATGVLHIIGNPNL